ncbi:MAG TPA: cupin domain-containing protein [Desulfobacteraceae bacterium]|mgnify:CR=1 FL=1|jgi:transcriptional regulator with XRE-family HTH domain|nr:cupin domain-containing protein [Desulfobacteraceae bacterium]
MTDFKEEIPRRDAYDDFLGDVGDHGREEGDVPGQAAHGGDIPVNVGARLKQVREERGLSLSDISSRTGLDDVFLAQVEAGEISPPLGSVIKLSKALDMKIGYFISGEGDKQYTIVRVNDRKVVSRFDSMKSKQYGYEYEALAPHKKNRHMDPFLVTLNPAQTEHERSSHEGQEFIYVIRGSMEVRLGDEVHVLGPRDCIYYDSTVPHLVKCHGDEETKILAVLYTEK